MENETYYHIIVGARSTGEFKAFGEYVVSGRSKKKTSAYEGAIGLNDKNQAMLKGILEVLLILKKRPPMIKISIAGNVIEFKEYLANEKTYLGRAVAYLLSDVKYEIVPYKLK